MQADTLIAPNGRINDPTMGTILVSVTGVNGAGVPGLTVTVTPNATNPNGALPVTPGPAATDVQGCSYALKVAPGNYDVKISTTAGDYVNEKQQATETQTKLVVAGDSTEADFQFDKASVIDAIFAGNVGTSGIQFPSNLVVNWASENAVYSTPVSVPVSKTVRYLLHPFANGYDAFTGPYVAPSLTPGGAKAPDCISPDPGKWTTPNLAGVVGQRMDAQHVSTLPGGSATMSNLRMGVVNVSGVQGKFLTVQAATASPSSGIPDARSRRLRRSRSRRKSPPAMSIWPFLSEPGSSTREPRLARRPRSFPRHRSRCPPAVPSTSLPASSPSIRG
ncbi:carboxypeptidase-like regulatory domain-containing protein [Leifsonia poae]|uniref:carboxypeptidase-like regulatory domain-containing protein n=1 Tax=Leifsonia poae TaxID=110933 RepID=UPI003D66A82A